ncbi:hypothetical protein Tco_0817850 [Tanacetum coccineum]
MVAYLEKSTENVDFDEIVDFLNANPMRYALIYLIHTILQCLSSKSTAWNEFGTNIASAVISLAKNQKFNFSKLIFDAVFNVEYATPSHTKKVFANIRMKGKDFSGTETPLFATMIIHPQADVDEGSGQPIDSQHPSTTALPSHVEPIPVPSSSQPQKTYRPRKAKRPTEISQSSGPITLVADETVHEERGDRMERAATTTSSLEAEQDSGTINRTQSKATLNESIPQGTGSGSGPRRQDTILGDRPAQTKLSERVLALENIKTAQDLKITNLKKRVKKLERKKKSRTLQLKRRLFKVRIESSTEKSLEDAKTQGRYGHDIEINIASTSITTVSINITTAEPVTTASVPITTAGVSVSTAEPSTPPTITLIEDEDLTIAQTLMKMRSVKSKRKIKGKKSI